MVVKTRLFLLFILLVPTSYFAQSGRERVVLWGGDPACGYRGKAIAADEKVSCSSIETPRGTLTVINHDGLSLAVGFTEEDGRMIAAVLLKNSTSQLVEFDTDLWGAAYFRTAESFYKGARPLTAETAIPSRDIIREVKSDVALDNSADVFMAGITKASEVRQIRNSDGTSTRKVVIIDDPNAQTDAASRGESRSQQADDKLAQIRRSALTQRWVAASDQIKGLVYFRRIKKAKLVVFSFAIGDTVYMFRQLRSNS